MVVRRLLHPAECLGRQKSVAMLLLILVLGLFLCRDTCEGLVRLTSVIVSVASIFYV